MLRAYEDRVIDQWKQTREIAYTIYCLGTDKDDRVHITEFMRLEGDPDLKELKLSRKDQLINSLIQKGVLVPRKKTDTSTPNAK